MTVTAIAVTLVVMAAIVALSAVFAYRHTPGPPASTPPPTTLAAEFTQLENNLHAKMGIAVSAVANDQAPMTLGDWQEGPAWSTIKVPLVIAAYRQANPPRVTDLMRAAITESDNAAAESLWAHLGDPATADPKGATSVARNR
jgi:beta-lactamase class A